MCWSARDSRAIQITGMLKVETRPEFAHTTHAPRALSHAMRSHTHRARRARAPLSLPPVPLPCSAARTCAHAHAHTHAVFRSPCLCSALGSRRSALGSRTQHARHMHMCAPPTHMHVHLPASACAPFSTAGGHGSHRSRGSRGAARCATRLALRLLLLEVFLNDGHDCALLARLVVEHPESRRREAERRRRARGYE